MPIQPKGMSGSGSLTLDLYGDLNSWSVRPIVDALHAAPDADVLLRINSPGGDVTEGFFLASALRSHGGRKVAVVEGVCASAATFPACACDEVRMHPESLLMIHAPWGFTEGNPEEMTSYAEVLTKMGDLCVQMYKRKTGEEEALVRKWMQKDTWLKPDEAKALKFCDVILESPAPKAAQAQAVRYLARVKGMSKPPNKKVSSKMELTEDQKEKLAGYGLAEDADLEDIKEALAKYMAESDDPPAERKEMARAVAELEDMKAEGEEDVKAEGEDTSSGDKLASLKLKASPNLDPAVAKLVNSLTSKVGKMSKKLDVYQAKERSRAEDEFYASASKHTTREDAEEYVSLCRGDFAAALKLIQKLPARGGALGRVFAGGSPIAGRAPGTKGVPMDRTKTIQIGHQRAHLCGYAFSAYAKQVAKERGIPIAEAQLVAAREKPELLQK